MSLRLILIVIGALIVAAILIDGFRHWRRARKHKKHVESMERNIEPTFDKKINFHDDIEVIHAMKLENMDAQDTTIKNTTLEEISFTPPPAPTPEPQIQTPSPVLEEIVLSPKPARANNSAPNNIPAPMPKKDKFIILHVLAEADTYFSGEALAAKFAGHALHHGPMDIFHQYEYPDGSGDILFSVANAFEPGTLNIDYPKGFYTQGLTLFIQLPGECDVDHAFEAMLNTATVLAKSLNARLCDHQRQPLTAAKVEEYRNEVHACNVI